MKKAITIIILSMISFGSYSQDYSELNNIPLKEKDDYKKAEDKVLECSNYLLNNPMDNKNVNQLNSDVFIIDWMIGTPDYTFEYDEKVNKMIKENSMLFGLYMACISKYVLENKGNANDIKKVKLNSVKLFIEYCKEPKNKVVLNAKLKSLIKAEEDGELEKYLKI